MELIDVKSIIMKELGSDESKPVLDALENFELKEAITLPPPFMDGGKTRGDWRISYPYMLQDIRPSDALSYTIIDEMMKSGVVRFAVDMKRGQQTSIFRNKRSTKVHCADENLARVTEAALERILPQMAFEFTHSALVNGCAVMELLWESKTEYELGLTDTPSDKYWTVPKVPNLVPHRTVSHFNRKKDGSYDGFEQIPNDGYIGNRMQYLNNEGNIAVNASDSLVIPYNGYSRNLWGDSMLKPIYPLWFWYEIILRATVQFSQLMGDPPRIGKAPSRKKVRLSKSSNLVDAIDYLLSLSANLPKTNSIVIPSDRDESGNEEWSIGYMQLPDRSQPFVQIIELFNKLILRASLSGDSTLISPQGESGGRAIGEVHAEATALHNEMIINNWLHYINRYFMPLIARHNLGDPAPGLYLEVQGLDPREREFLNNIMNIAGNSATFQEFFYRVDWENLGRMSGLPMLSEDQADELKQKLHEESMSNQEDMLSMQKKFSDGTGSEAGTKKAIDDNTQKKLDEFVENNTHLFFTEDELTNVALSAIMLHEKENDITV
jgi:hypothetical protein